MRTKKSVFCTVAAILLLVTALAFPAGAAEKKGEAGKKTGLVKEDGKTHIYSGAGTLVRDVPVYVLKTKGKKTYYHVDQAGRAKKLTGLEETAAKRLEKLKAGGKKSIGNLKKAFMWSAGLKYRSNTNGSKGSKAAKYYGKYGFSTGSGDCNTAAYTFYWMAKVLGYPPKVVQGHVPSGSMSNLKAHTWVTMKMDKKTWYFDPDYNRACAGKTVRTRSGNKKLGKYCGFRFLYGTPGTYIYKK